MREVSRLPVRKWAGLLLLLCMVLAQPACGGLLWDAASGVVAGSHPRPGFNLFTHEQDIELGKASAEEAVREVRLVTDERVKAYVERVGARLAAHAPGYEFPYRFAVVDAPEVNAYAFPGGYVFVNSGAIAAAQNEGELAAVLAHEIAHVALRHGTNQASKAYVTKTGLDIIDALAGGRQTALGQLAERVGGAGAELLFQRLGRSSETEADLEGVRLMAAAGYDPRDMARFFENLGEVGGARSPEALSDHPDPRSRVAAINEAVNALPAPRTPARDSEEFRRVKKRLRGF
jgi:predicted Zn-dependent protease